MSFGKFEDVAQHVGPARWPSTLAQTLCPMPWQVAWCGAPVAHGTEGEQPDQPVVWPMADCGSGCAMQNF